MLPPGILKKIILQNKFFDPKEWRGIENKAKEANVAVEQYLLDKKLLLEEQIYKAAAAFYQVPFIDLRGQNIKKEVLFLLSEPYAVANQVLPFERDGDGIKIAALRPDDLQLSDFIQRKTGLTPKFYFPAPTSLKEALKQYRRTLKAEFEAIAEEAREERPLQELAQELPIVRVVDTFLEHAILESASDIHIEPAEKEVIVRFRVDGILRPAMNLPKSIAPGIVARIKILANLKIDEHRLPQDGRFKIITQEYRYSVRVSVIPVYDGEKIVLRLLNEATKTLTLEQLGLRSKSLAMVQAHIKKPHGIILVTGPTGCGKTTTLYSILNILNMPGVNISTVEDPIEYRIPGVNQSQVNPRIGFTFATGLRALLRQDPNILMVGEIRDAETAEIAIHAALTGHLVLSTLHTNDAATALPRLIDMGAPPFLVASTVSLVVAQRLVRKLCPDCRESYKLSAQEIKDLQKQYPIAEILKTLCQQGAITDKQTLESLLFFRSKGCPQCHKEGYRGRVGIYEVLEMTPEMTELVQRKTSSDVIAKTAKQAGMITMLADGFMKAKEGITTIAEILRVTKE